MVWSLSVSGDDPPRKLGQIGNTDADDDTMARSDWASVGTLI